MPSTKNIALILGTKHVETNKETIMSNPFTTKDPLFDIINQVMLGEKKLTDAEMKKREEIAQAMERDNPGMDMGKKMAIATATAKKVAEEVNLQEITTKSGADVDRNLDDHDPEEHGDIPDRKPDHELETHGGTTLHVHHVKDSKGKTTHTIINHVHDPAGGGTFVVKGHAHPKHILSSYNRAEREDMYESVNLDEQLENFWEAYTTMFNEAEDQQQNMLLRAMAKDPSDLMKMKRAIKMGDKALTNPALRQEILKMLDQMMTLTTTDKSLLQRTRMGFQKAKTMKMPEEVQLEAIGAKDKQDEGEYGYEGDMAMSQLRTIIRNCQEMMKVLDKETDMPEWVQSKITLATDYLQTANDYLMSELEEAANPAQQAAIAIAMKKSGKKPKNKEVEKSPIDGARPVKSKESAAVRVMKIAKGMEKLNTPKDKK
jgi:hypothetical protein